MSQLESEPSAAVRKQQPGTASAALVGAAAGALGTAAMTLFMKPGLVRFLPSKQQPVAFVPREIVTWAERRILGRYVLNRTQRSIASTVSHIGYGASMGAVYGMTRRRTESVPAAVAGGVWGLLVWVAGYQGWLPAAGVRPATTSQRPAKWPVPIANHVVYGISTALAYEALRRRA